MRKWKLFAVFSMIAAFLFVLLPTVETEAAGTVQVEVNKRTNYLYLYENGKVTKTYRVATGKTSDLTPEGTFTVVFKTTYPGWKGIPGGDPKNPLGSRWIGIQVNGDNGRTYGIHGTNNPSSIGTHASNGCIRMYNSQVEELYNKVPTGTKVWIHSGTSNGVWRGTGGTSPNPPAVTPMDGKVQITATNVNVRSGASLESSVIGRANKPEVYQLTGKAGEWYRINYKGQTAYIHSDYAVKVDDSTTPATGHVQVTATNLNVRSAASLSAPIIGRVNKPEVYELTGIAGEWYQINYKGQTGYIHSDYAVKQ